MSTLSVSAIVFGSFVAYFIGGVITHAYFSCRKELCKKWTLDPDVASFFWVFLGMIMLAKALHRCATRWFQKKAKVPKATTIREE